MASVNDDDEGIARTEKDVVKERTSIPDSAVQHTSGLLPVKNLSQTLNAMTFSLLEGEEGKSQNDDEEKNSKTVFSLSFCKGCLRQQNEVSPLSKDWRGFSRVGRHSPFIEYSLANLQLSPAKKKPLLRKSKLAVLGAKYSSEVRSGSSGVIKDIVSSSSSKDISIKSLPPKDEKVVVSCEISSMLSDVGLLKINKESLKTFQVPSSGVFEMLNSKTVTEDFASVSQSGKSICSDRMNTVKKLEFSPMGCKHRGQPKSRRALYKRRCRRQLPDGELPDLKSLSLSDSVDSSIFRSCSQQARSPDYEDVTMDELAAYLDNFLYLPRKMSQMAEMMYT